MAQVYEGYEVIAVDDGSTDMSAVLLDAAALEYPDRFTVVHTENRGAWQARKTGFELARGEYVGFCDSDDEPSNRFVQTLAQRAFDTGADIVVCAFERCDAAGERTLSTEMTSFGDGCVELAENPGILPSINTALWNKLFRREVLVAGLMFATPARVGEDVVLNLAAYAHSHRLTFVSEPLYRYRTRPGSLMASVTSEDFEALERSFLEVRELIAASRTKDASQFLAVCDLMAFIHIGISLQERFCARQAGHAAVEQREAAAEQRKIARLVRTILERSFPQYRHNPYATLRYNRTHSNSNLMLLIALWAYRLRLLMPSLRLYRAATARRNSSFGW
jgi:hypothetical protein